MTKKEFRPRWGYCNCRTTHLKEAAESPGHSNVASFVSLLKKYNRFAERLWAYVQGSVESNKIKNRVI